MALRILVMTLVPFCLAVAGQENERKNIKMLFVPADVMKALRKNLTTKDLPPGLPGQGTQRWTPVRLPGDKTHTFEIRINPRTAHKLNMNFQHFRVGRGHGLLLELKNVSLSTKGKTVLDRLVEFYKNCGSGRGHRIGMRPGMHMLHRLEHLHPTMHHSLLLPGDVPLLKRIQNALERFFPKRHDGSVDVFQHKDSSGAVHFLPFEEVRREVNNLIKRTLVKRDCVKISTNALTRALDAFRRQLNNETAASSTQNESFNVSDERDRENSDSNGEEGGDEGEEKDQVLSFSRNLDSFNPHPVNKVNLTSSSAMNVPSDAAATKIVSALADLRKEINDLSSGFRKIPKDSNSSGISVGTDDDTTGSNGNIVKISSDNNEAKDGKNANHQSFDISTVKNRRKKMSTGDSDDVGKKINSNNDNNNNNNNSNNKTSRSNSDIGNNKGIMLALKLKNIEEDLKTQLVNDFLKQAKNFSKITSDSEPNSHLDGNLEDSSNVKVTNVKPVHPVFNQVVNHLQRAKAAKEVKVNKTMYEHVSHSSGTKKANKQARFKGRKERGRNKTKHTSRLEEKKKKRPSVAFHYKPKSLRLKLKYKGGKYVKADDEDEEGYLKQKGKGRLIRFIHMRIRPPKIKEVLLPDEEEDSEGYRERKFDDSPVDASEDDDSMKVRLLRKLRWLRIHGHGAKIRRRKSPKLRVVVYDDDEEEKQPHRDNWRSSESDELTEKVEKIHEDDSEADSESEAESESDSEPEADASSHRSDPVFMDDENTQQYNQGGTSNSSSDSDSESDMQYLSDSIGDESSHFGRGDSGTDVPDLEPYLKKHYENEEDEENEEIKMYNDQDGIDARKLSDSMEKRKTPKAEDTILNEKTNKVDDGDGEQPGKIHIHKIPFKIQEDSDGVDTSLLKEPPHDALGLQQVFSHESDMPSMSPGISSMPSTEMSSMAPSQITSMAPQPVAMASNAPLPNQNAMDMSPNMVMPPEQSTMIPAAAELPQMNGGAQAVRPNVAAFNYQPSVTTQVNSMMPQTPFPQVSSMMPMQMQAGAPEVSPMTPVMQPGQMRAVISRSGKKAPKKSRSKKRAQHVIVSGVGHKLIKLRNKSRQSSKSSTA